MVRFAAPFQSLLLDAPIHSFKPGDQVLVQKWKKNPLAEKWEGPYQVLLTTHTAVRLANNDKWTHCSRVKPFHTNSQGVITPEADNTREQEANKWTSEPEVPGCLPKLSSSLVGKGLQTWSPHRLAQGVGVRWTP
ncbi:hypothetical protein Y1Q_0016644 [Alligator mississippiensis]|uniref:Murine leukemia virus integrase C-terminal domain-containing protein n=1 Tax=Alligator mississippiensis TaxID=8496 RepID=A0A151P1A5_ALLMI|nr:hypothetical protein Y1Q_0016644 [Alligator mississippiensis]